MEENMEIEKSKFRFLFKISMCFTLVLIVFLLTQGNFTNNFAVSANSERECLYLSDIPYDAKQSKAEWGKITYDKNLDGNNLSVIVEGGRMPFSKGIIAHATSTVVYDISQYQYQYFTAFIGVDASMGSSGDGVKIYIYTSTDGKEWQLKTSPTPNALTGRSEALFVTVDITGAKYIKLYADKLKNNAQDHAVYCDAKLVNELNQDEVVQSVEEYNEIIKTKYTNQEQITGEYELTLLQRELVKNVGQYTLSRFINEKEENKQVFNWLFNDLENLRLYILGGAPDGGSYYNSLNVLSNLYATYKNDFDIAEKTKYGTKLGDLYKRMAISLSLTHSTTVGLWMNNAKDLENQSNAITRYQIYKDMHKNGNLVVSERQDHSKWFEEYKIEEMRYVMNNIIDDPEILWLNEYTQKRIDAHPNQEEKYLQPHTYMKYVAPNYHRPEYYAEEYKEQWDEKYEGIFSKYGVPYGSPNVEKLWMNIESGSVCGGISKIGSNIRAAHGTPSSVISQPGHAAIIYYRKDAQGRGYWTIDNDVSGWAQSGKTERLSIRMPLGWGNGPYVSGWAATYIQISQEAINNFENYEKAEKLVMLAKVYDDNPTKKEEILRKAIEVQEIHLDAWWELIQLYKADNTKTEQDYYRLAEELGEALMPFPLPMKNLLDQIKGVFTSNEYSFKYTLLETRLLNEGKTLTSSDKVYQPSVTRTVASYLLGQVNTTLASFSFDGQNAGKIVLSNRFDGSGIRWDYSLDGKKSWKEVSFTAEEEHKLQLTPEQIASITAENDIYVHIVGLGYEEENLFKIDIQNSAGIPANLYANDWENKLIGASGSLQWKLNGNDKWTSYSEQEPDLTGDKTVIIRVGATGVYLASNDTKTYHFTEDNQLNTRKYIPISHLSIHSVSSEATGQGRHARNAIDGNINTNWHSDWNGGDKQKYIIIKLDEPKYLSALEYFPAGGGNGKIKNAVISVSEDGENWTEVVSETNWAYTDTMKSVDFEPTKAQYIKIVGKETQAKSSSLSFIAVNMFNLYEDITSDQEPIVEISSEKYQIEEGYISKILPLTTLNEFKQNIQTNQEMTIADKDGNMIELKSIIETGMILKVGDKQYTLIVRGDVDGDGEITINDLAKVKLHFIGSELLTGSYLRAADIDCDDEITINDIAQIKLVLIDLLKIN